MAKQKLTSKGVMPAIADTDVFHTVDVSDPSKSIAISPNS